MENKVTRRQHIVPKFYLKQFTDVDGYLHCYKKTGGKYFPARPNDICFKDYGYEVENPFGPQRFLLANEIENMFCSLEGEYSSVLHSVVDKCSVNSTGLSLICTSREKETLASMVANFITRNFLVVSSFVDEDVTQDLLRNDQEIKAVDCLLREMNMGEARPFLELAQMKMFLSPSEDGVTKRIVEDRLGMNLSFFVTHTSSFITSDYPVGYNCTSEELLMARIPLSTKVMAVYSKSNISRQFRNRAQLIENRFVDKLNHDYFNWNVPEMIIGNSYENISYLLE